MYSAFYILILGNGCGPYEWSVADHDWVWSESAAGILIGEGFAAPVDESEVPKYIAMLEERYGKK